MKYFLLLLALSLSTQAFAKSETQFYCANVGGTEEWTISVDLKAKQAGFFDNDTTTVVDLVAEARGKNGAKLYIFEGEDTGSAEGDRLKIVFNKTELQASVHFIPKKGRTTVKRSYDGCVAEKDSR